MPRQEANNEPSLRDELNQLKQHVKGLSIELENQKKENEELLLFKRLIELSSEAVAISDPEGKLVYINPAHEKLFGRYLKEAQKVNYREYYPPESIKILNEVVSPMLKRGESWEGVLDVYNSSGYKFPLWERAGSVFDEKGNMIFGFGFMHDVSQQKQIEEKLRENEIRYRNIIEHSDELFYLHNSDHQILYVSPQCKAMLGYTQEEMLVKWTTLTSDNPINTKGFKLTEKAIRTGKKQKQYPLELIRKDGNTILVIVDESPIKDDRGKVIGITGALQDVTDKIRAEQELEISEQNYRSIFEQVRHGITILDLKGYINDVNKEVTRQFGDNKSELIGKHFSNLNLFSTEEIPEIFKTFSKLTRDKFISIELNIKNQKDEKLILLCSARLFRSKKSAIEIMVISNDVTEQRQAEQRIKDSLNEKEVLLKEIHHRVKNNLQIVSSLLNLQSRHIADKNIQALFKESQSRVKSIALVHEKLYRSPDLAKINIAEYINSLIKDLKYSYGLDTRKVKIHVNVGETALKIVQAIPCGLIINELVSNCMKHAFPPDWEGDRKIFISLLPFSENELELIVRDTGIGLQSSFDLNSTDSFGLNLFALLAEDQLEGKISIQNENGITFRVKFRKME